MTKFLRTQMMPWVLAAALGLLLAGRMATASDGDAFATLLAAAEKNNAEAQYQVGKCYALGDGVPQDDRQAIPWYQKAADQGNIGAQLSLGLMYAEGRGVPQDDTQAVTWYRKAAEQGHAKAQYNLAFMYHSGRGVSQDDINAYAWYALAANQGQANAADGRDLAASQLNAEQLREATALTAELRSKIQRQSPP